jgi:hypothetical protein
MLKVFGEKLPGGTPGPGGKGVIGGNIFLELDESDQ